MMIRLCVLFTILLSMTAFAQRKNVAVVETMVDQRSGAANDISKAEVELITSEIRSSAVRHLPRGKFSIMTTETVQSMGDAVLQECAEENCVIALGSKIGADYITRGVISKFRQNLMLTIEIFETEYGMLLATATVRTANLDEILEKTAAACAAMYKDFMDGLTEVEQMRAARQAARDADTPSAAPIAPIAPAASAAMTKKEKMKLSQRVDDDEPLYPAQVEMENFTAGERWGTFALNLVVPGLGSGVIMRDRVGVVTQSVFGIVGYILLIAGSGSGSGTDITAGFVILLCDLPFNIARSASFDKITNVYRNGMIIGALPDHNGNINAYVSYSVPF